jgi:hypothetical protein
MHGRQAEAGLVLGKLPSPAHVATWLPRLLETLVGTFLLLPRRLVRQGWITSTAKLLRFGMPCSASVGFVFQTN